MERLGQRIMIPTRSEFLTVLGGDWVSDEIFELTKTLEYYSALLECVIRVPIGFQTDLASVPRVPIIYEMFGNRAHHESVIHDYLYRKDSAPLVSFGVANKAFKEAMEARGKTRLIVYGMYKGVCSGGASHFHKKCVGDKLLVHSIDSKEENNAYK